MPLVEDGLASLNDMRAALNEGLEIGCDVFLNAKTTRQRRDAWFRVSANWDLTQNLVAAGSRSLLNLAARAADGDNLHEFDFDAMVSGSVGIALVRELPQLQAWLGAVPGGDWPTVFDGDEEVVDDAGFYSFRLTFPDGRAVLAFRSRRGLEVVARRKGAVQARFSRDQNELVPVEGSIITFDQAVDFFVWDGMVFIGNLPTFEALTNLREITIQKAAQAVDALAGRFDLGDVDALKASIGQRTRLGKKLAAAQRHGLAGDIDPAAIHERIEARGLQVRCEIDGEQVRFEIDSTNPQEVSDFVDLMTDVFLRSPLTGREWDALAKRPSRRQR
jgi:hypothetical protein